jgi:CRISPR system Cascade subunit CasD
MPRFLILRLDAPLIAFGATVVDNRGFTARFPALSMITGLLANALGWDRRDRARLQTFQDRLVLASRVEGEAVPLRDFQTVRLGDIPGGWTTRGVEERAGASGDATHIRFRDFWTGITATVALALDPADLTPTLEECAAALRHPARPLFLGRKPCLPSRPLLEPDPFVAAESARGALDLAGPPECLGKGDRLALQWPAPALVQDVPAHIRVESVTDQRVWSSGVHGGARRVFVEDRRHD